MYTLEQLQQKTFKELKKIGWQLNVLPDSDRRCRHNWINALVGVNPPLLQLLEVSPDSTIPRYEAPTQEPPIDSKFGRIVYPKPAVKPIAQNAETTPQLDRTESADVHNRRSHPAESVRDSDGAEAEALGSKEGDRVLAVAGHSQTVRGGVLPHQSIELAAIFNDEQPPNRGEGKGRVEPKVSQSVIVPAVKNSPGVSRKISTAHQLLELFKSSAHVIEDSPVGSTEAETAESAIGSAAQNLLDAETDDQNPILAGITFSDGFLARYSPPQPALIHFKADADGQLSLLDFEVETEDEPPDPDDFESLDAFREAIAFWDTEHEPVSDRFEPLSVLLTSLESMCEWAPCPDDWYEPSEVSELSSVPKSSSTCNFSIPTFDRWCDRPNRQNDTDEPPDTGIFAKLPGPKPPKFPPGAIAYQSHDSDINAAQTHITHIAAGSNSQSGRDPPGGDAM